MVRFSQDQMVFIIKHIFGFDLALIPSTVNCFEIKDGDAVIYFVSFTKDGYRDIDFLELKEALGICCRPPKQTVYSKQSR